MTRPDGFQTADHDVGFLVDDRVLDAVELVGPVAVVAYLAVRDASWARGERVDLTAAVRRLPALYGLDDVLEEVAAALLGVGLLDAEGRIPRASWDVWFGAAAARREIRRARGRAGGLAKSRNRGASTSSAHPNGKPNTSPSTSSAQVERKSTRALPDRPYDLPDGRSVVREDDPTDPYAGASFRDRVAAAGGPEW